MHWGLSALVVVLVAGGLSPAGALPAQEEPAGEPVDWWDDLSEGQAGEPEAPPFTPATSAPLEQDNPGDVASVAFPEPDVAAVSLGDKGDAEQVGDTPIDIAAASTAVEGADLQVEVLDREVTAPAGVSGFAMRVSGEGGASLAATAEATDAASLPVKLEVDTAGWGDMYGADYPSRVVVVALPDCALEDPVPADCDRNGVPVPSHLNAETGKIVIEIDDISALDSATLASDETPLVPAVQVDDFSGNAAVSHQAATTSPSGDEPDDSGPTTVTTPPSTDTQTQAETESPTQAETQGMTDTEGLQGSLGDRASGVAGFDGTSARALGGTQQVQRVLQSSGGSAVLALTSAPTAEGGNWGATPLELSGDWLVGMGSGEFSWSYQIPVPPAPGGATPSVGLSYSSGSIDGMVTGRNVQAGQVGLGWSDFASSFIERRYAPCDEGEVFHDLCWRSHNATISLNGHQSELVPVSGEGDTWQSWVLKEDPHWKVQRRSDFVPNGDNNGENWRVTTPDGTEYWFGIGIDPENGATNSAWTVPVFANDTGEPCRGAGDTLAWCNQAWRWNLDRVVDPDGNVTVYRYFKEENKYGILNGWGDATYNNGGRLAWIEYGLREDDTSVQPAGKVEFKGGYRCNRLDDPTPCPAPTPENGDGFKDVPNEFICDADCLIVSPTFFSTKRYTEVWTYMRVPGQGYPAVDVVRLNHSMANEDEGNKNLWLRSIQRIGKVGLGESGLALPPVTFHGVQLQNRVDYDLGAGKTPMSQYRVNGIFEEYGRDIHVQYGRPNGCTPGTNPHTIDEWDTNHLTCFPQYWRPPNSSSNEVAVFHKWLVDFVEVNDAVGGADPIVYSYDYGTTPAWHHNDDEFLNNDKKTWSDWRGYDTTRITVGSGDTRTATRYRVYRGMDGDRLYPIPGAGRKDVQVTSLNGTLAVDDDEWLKGRILDEWRIDTDDNRLTSKLTQYVADVTSDWGGEPQDDAHWVGVAEVTNTYKRLDGSFAQTRTETTYNTTDNPTGDPNYVADYMPRWVLDRGWLGTTGDERCTRTSYVSNTSLGIYGLPYSQAMVSGSDCTATADSDLLRRQQWHYDGGALAAEPTKGHVTKTRVLKSGTDTWLGYTQTAYDSLGRPTQITDPNNHTTTTDYVPDVGNLTSSIVTNHLGHATETTYNVERGLPVIQEDANGKMTALVYDGLGRLVQVYRPGEVPFVNNASLRFGYDVDPDKEDPPVVRTRRLVNDTGPVYQDAWVVYDGLLRQRQTHSLSPEEGKVIVQSTWYDSHGRVRSRALPQAVAGTAGSGILAPADGKQWANQTRPTYDLLDRVVQDTFYGVNGDATALVERWHTSTAYDVDKTWVTPPTGGPTQTVTDAYGNVTSVSEGAPSAPWTPVSFHTTSYGYNLAGDLTTVTDPASNLITYTYDKAGRRTAQNDPDAGAWSYTYDDVGNHLTTTDALSHTITTDYDALNRPTLRHEGATNLASWAYDATGEKGLLDSSTRVTSGGDWVTDITGYDVRNRPTGKTVTVPAGIPGLSGSYTTSYGYNRADQPTSIGYPAVGGLSAETATTTYDETLGLPATLTGADTYTGVAAYDDRARPLLFGYGLYSGQYTLGRLWTYNADQRLESVSNAVTGGTEVTRHDMVYDEVGNITQRTTKLGTSNFRECFTYDAYQRLTRAVTTTTSTACSTNPATPSGSLPYEQDFTHSVDGNLLTRDDGSGAVSYTYPTTGSPVVRPHAPTQVGSDTYQWDANGDLDSRTVGGITTDFTFDHEHNLASTSSPAGTSTFVYDADDQRLYRQTPQGSTLYLDGQEVNATPGGSPTVTATRLYTFGGQLVAVRTAAGGVDYLVSDHQGSVEAKVDAAGTTVSAQQAYKPYGQSRTTDTFATQRGWIGQVGDPSTGLSYLNARYYDANIGRFISPDPLYDTAQIKSINPYTYAWANPVTGSDPSGLANIIDNGSSPETCVDCSPGYLHDHPDTHHDGGGICSTCGGGGSGGGQNVLALLAQANSDPGFWKALAAAGSAEALSLLGLSLVNGDPGFWKALSEIGGTALAAIGKQLLKTLAEADGSRDPQILHWGRGGSVVHERTGQESADIPGPGCHSDDEDYCEWIENLPSCRDVGVVRAGHGYRSAEPCNWTPAQPTWLCKTAAVVGVGEAVGTIVEKAYEDPQNLPGAVAQEAPAIAKVAANPLLQLGTALFAAANC